MAPNDLKLLSLEHLKDTVDSLKNDGKRIIHCHGVFDLLHIGHIRYFEQARRMGDVLIVTLTPDRFVDKGPQRPAFAEGLRAEAIASLKCVDHVAINRWATAEETLRMLRPDVYVKGSEFRAIDTDVTGKMGKEAEVVNEIGVTLAFTDDVVFSSSSLINQYVLDIPEEVKEYFHLLKQRYSLEEILEAVESMTVAKVLVVGDAILDEYQYCEAIGKSSKDPILATKYQSHDLYAGGALAVANHGAGFADRVDIFTVLGQTDRYEDFILSQLQPNVVPHFRTKDGAPTTIKRRYIDGYTMNKLFEVYVMDDSKPHASQNKRWCKWLKDNLSNYDVVIAADFGHGFVSPEMISCLTEYSKYLVVMTQANAGNRGFNTISRYPRADYVCIAEHEIRMEMRDLESGIPAMVEMLAPKFGCSLFVVTRGRKGCIVWRRGLGVVEIPAFAQKAVDRIGAGDAFLSVTSIAAAQSLPSELLGLIGNAVGCLAVGVAGNKKPVDRLSAMKCITSLLK
jgi:rfaE bifunctional protein nucleotidyltransferase chain/domain